MTKDIKKLELAVGTASALIVSEHFFSTMLSSPWSTQKFTKSVEDAKMVRKLYILASVFSLATAFYISYLIKERTPIFATLFLIIIYVYIYEKAISGQL